MKLSQLYKALLSPKSIYKHDKIGQYKYKNGNLGRFRGKKTQKRNPVWIMKCRFLRGDLPYDFEVKVVVYYYISRFEIAMTHLQFAMNILEKEH